MSSITIFVRRRRACVGIVCFALATSGQAFAQHRVEVPPGSELGIPDPARTSTSTSTLPDSEPVSPTPSDGETGPSAASPSVASPDRVDERPISLPMGAWTELDARCRIITTFRSSGEGCGLSVRRGHVVYFQGGIGFFTTPQYERYVRYVPENGSSSPSTAAKANQWSTTVIDPTRDGLLPRARPRSRNLAHSTAEYSHRGWRIDGRDIESGESGASDFRFYRFHLGRICGRGRQL